MTDDASTVLREALALPADELERRARQLLRDPSRGEDGDAARQRIADRLDQG